MHIRSIEWDLDAWDDYIYWHTQDKKTLNRLNKLIKDMTRHPFEGIGKPEPLKDNLTGLWSRRIDETNRVVYLVENEKIVILSCRNHY